MNKYVIGLKLNEEAVFCSYKGTSGSGLLDRTGGYGQPDVPLKLGYVKHTGQWLIGEDVLALDFETDTLVEHLVDLCHRKKSIEFNGISYNPETLIAMFCEQVIEYLYQVDPKAELDSVHVLFCEGYGADSKASITNELTERLAVPVTSVIRDGAWYLRIAKPWLEQDPLMLLNYDRSSMSLWVSRDTGLEKLAEENIGVAGLEQTFIRAVSHLYRKHQGDQTLSAQSRQQLEALTAKYLPMLFVKAKEGKPLKLAFNQVFPPFQAVMTAEEIRELIDPWLSGYQRLVKRIEEMESGRILCTGDGFRMGWTLHLLKESTDLEVVNQWAREVLALAELPSAGSISVFEKKSNQAYGIIIKEPSGMIFYPLIEEGFPLRDIKCQLMASIDEREVRLVQPKGDGYTTVLKTMLEHDSNSNATLVELNLSFDGDGQPTMSLEKLPL